MPEIGEAALKNRFIFDEKDSREIIEYFFKGRTEGIDKLGLKGRILATDLYQDAWDTHFNIKDLQGALGNPLSKSPYGRGSKSIFSSEGRFKITALLTNKAPFSSPLEALQGMKIGGATRAGIINAYGGRLNMLAAPR